MTELDFSYEIGLRIRRKRIERKLSREDLAQMVGVHRNSIWRWEEGDAPMTMWDFLRVCHALAIPHFVMLPAVALQRAKMLEQMLSENGIGKKSVQRERDPRLTDAQIRRELGVTAKKAV